MKQQQVTVKLPHIQVVIGTKPVAELIYWTNEINTIKGLRGSVQRFATRFIKSVSAQTRSCMTGSTGTCTYFNVPEIKVTLGEEVIFYSRPITIDSLQDLNRFSIPDNLYTKIPSAVADACAYAIEKQEIDIVFEETGTTVTCPLKRRVRSWGWSLLLTETMLSYELGRKVSIKYGSFLHNALYRFQEKLKEHEIDKATVTTLIKLELLGYKEDITTKGAQVLEELNEIDPADVPGLVVLFAGTLLGSQKEHTPLRKFAAQHEYINDSRNKLEILQKGKGWLRDNCLQVLNRASCPDSRRVALIAYMPQSHLPTFLSHTSSSVRAAARQRMREIQGRS